MALQPGHSRNILGDAQNAAGFTNGDEIAELFKRKLHQRSINPGVIGLSS